ncbi:unnamed protein product [Cuscuta europaea]|uniref:Zinc knuckle CX2CX4HX4C domain-containing protein n=1 Tax=Cuscuta europaea TaxID=41803 RepID=A0A9P0ZEX0_CUSEU|nr:unnamed protein product [Cuscuta europaea]
MIRVAKIVGNKLESFVKLDDHLFEGKWRDYLRIRVFIDVRPPLWKDLKVQKSNGDCLWVNLKYEKLPNFCFTCGLIGYGDKFCPQVLSIPRSSQMKEFGLRLRAGSGFSNKGGGNKWLVVENPNKQRIDINEGVEGSTREREIVTMGSSTDVFACEAPDPVNHEEGVQVAE